MENNKIYEKLLFELVSNIFPILEGNKIEFVVGKKFYISKRTRHIYRIRFNYKVSDIDGSEIEYTQNIEIEKDSNSTLGNLITPYYDSLIELKRLLEVEYRKLKIKRLLNDTEN